MQIAEQTGQAIRVESRLPGGKVYLLDEGIQSPLWMGEVDSSWVVAYPNYYGEDYALELFTRDGTPLCRIVGDVDNQACWGQLLDALPTSDFDS